MSVSILLIQRTCFVNVVFKLVLSHVRPFVTPRTTARQAPLSLGFSRQEYWSGLLFPPLGDLPDPAIEAASPAWAGTFFTIWATRETKCGPHPCADVFLTCHSHLASSCLLQDCYSKTSPLPSKLFPSLALPSLSILSSPSKREGFPSRSAGKESACSAGDPGSIPGLGRSPGEGNG